MRPLWFTLIAISNSVLAQAPIQYHISFANAEHHEAKVVVTFPELQAKPLQVRMSRTSPGRYALHEFAKNVYNVRAFDSSGKRLKIARPNPHQWDVSGHDGTIKMTYTIFGDRSDGTYLAIDNTHAHVNMPATFMWARGLESRPIEITFDKPDPSWQVATQLVPTDKEDNYTAPNLDYFFDSPTEISHFELRTWELGSNGRTGTMRLALHHEGSKEEAGAYAEMCKVVVREEIAVYGMAPAFDNGAYTFIADYLPYVNGDGMEHRNSTILSSTRSLGKNAIRNINTVSHEFFHAWNVERMRPRSLQPFDFEKANMSGELWFAEGFTSYYDGLILKRAQLTSLDRFAQDLTGTLNTVLNAPGRKYFNLAEMSMQAPFVDAATSVDPNNKANTYISYYPYGAAIGLGLDLTLRKQFPGLTLDDFMRAAWEKHGKTEIPYTNEDLRKILGEVTGNTGFADDFFSRYIYGRQLPDYKVLLAQAGFQLRKANADKGWLGPLNFSYKDEKATITSSTLIDSPLYKAGLDRRDIILRLDGRAIQNKEALEQILDEYTPGDLIEIEFEKSGVQRKAELKLQADPKLEVVPYEHLGKTVSPAMLSFRAKWLASKSGVQIDSLKRFCPKCSRAFPFENEFCKYDGEELKITR